MSNLDHVTFGGKTVDRRTAAMLTEAQKLANAKDPSIGDFDLTQGSWSHAGASAGTHDGPGAFDMYTASYSSEQKAVIGMSLRTVGFASWRRERIPGKWEEHWHGIAMGTEGLPSIAQGQVRSYLNGRTGLIGDARDPQPRPEHVGTWEQYQERRGDAAEDQQAKVAEEEAAEKEAPPTTDPYAINGGKPIDADKDSDHDGLTDDFEKLAGTDTKQADTDADGLSDAYEAIQSHTDPLTGDTDADGLSDAAELAAGGDAGRIVGRAGVVGTGVFAENVRNGVTDSDEDGLSDRFEGLVGTDAKRADTDRDGLSDATEASLGTDPTLADSDYDGYTDGLEVEHGGDPLSSFVDGQGRTVQTTAWTPERAYARLHPAKSASGADSPGNDGPGKGEPVSKEPGLGRGADPYGIDPGLTFQHAAPLRGSEAVDEDSDHDGLTDAFEKLSGSDPTKADSDGDGQSDGLEAYPGAQPAASGVSAIGATGASGVTGDPVATGPVAGAKDSDGDGLSDRDEKRLHTDTKKSDTDGDGVSDAMEVPAGLDPTRADTDGDGISDGLEVQFGSDPLTSGSGLGPGLTNYLGGVDGQPLPNPTPVGGGEFDPS